MPSPTVNSLHRDRETVSDREDEHLRRNGWRATSRVAATWLWEYALADGTLLLVDKDTALALQGAMESSVYKHLRGKAG